MRDVYQGPAVLLHAGSEGPVHADLWQRHEPVNVPNDDMFGEQRPGPTTWGGTIEVRGFFNVQRLPAPAVLRVPDAGEGRVWVFPLEGGDAAPHRVEVEGAGPVPWEVNGSE